MDRRRKVRIGDVLVTSGLISDAALQSALERQKGSGQKLGEVLVDMGAISEEGIARALSEQLGYELVDLQNYGLNNISDEIKNKVNSNILQRYKVVPFAYEGSNGLKVAMSDPVDMNAIDDIEVATGHEVIPVVATNRSIMMALNDLYSKVQVNSALEEYAKEKEAQMVDENSIYDDADVASSPIVQLVKGMIEQAVRQRSSDIHIEPMETKVRVRYRIDGALYNRGEYSVRILPAMIARIKIIGGMDIAEKRKPQDGRITQIVDRREYDIRVSILPTVYGEKVVMRLTSKNALTRNKGQLGLKEAALKKFDRILMNPHGILLVTGPTGSGKSTTLYTALSELNKEDVNIITVEDPVEANIDGINQVQVNPKAELTFASSLRSILRQDPDIIMIGEIRDQETASIAVQASITGHLVVSTLHTNSAASTITRLEDMGLESYLIADSVIGVIAQRLVRRLCPECKIKKMATAEQLELLGLPENTEQVVYEPCGCPACDNTGFKGRVGVYEIMEMSQPLKSIIAKNGGAEAIKEQALKEGMLTLRMSATEYVLEGITSVSEMIKVSFDL